MSIDTAPTRLQRRRAVVLMAVIAACSGSPRSWAVAPDSAPPLPPPSGRVVNVSTEVQLQSAIGALTSGTTVLIAPGLYTLTSTLWINHAVSDVVIRGATNNRNDVVLAGPGMANGSYGAVPHGIWTGNGVTLVTIANLTIRDVYFHPIIFNPGTQQPRVYNVRLLDAGEQFLKSSPTPPAAASMAGSWSTRCSSSRQPRAAATPTVWTCTPGATG